METNNFNSQIGKNYLYSYFAICIIAICFCLAPLFVADAQPQIHDISRSGSLGDILRNSVTIKVMTGITIGTTLPVMVDIFLDKVSKISFFDLTNTFLVLFVIDVNGALYLSLNDQYYMTYLYITLYGIKMIVTTAAILYTISRGVIATQWKMNPLLFLFPIIGIAVINIFVTLTTLFPANYTFGVLLIISRSLTSIVYIVMQGCWFFAAWRHYRIYQRFGMHETKEITYMVGEVFFFISHFCFFAKSKSKENLIHTDEDLLILYYATLIFCSLFMTVIPGRLLRKISEIKESVLRLKREFVRYVSHEIRSPLNVAHAGLEILKAELELIGASAAILNLLDDIFSASNAAIEILNDMLHYEHLDSGTFKLELAVTPLLNVFAGRLEAYKYMASKKSINLCIEDLVQASEHYEGGGGGGSVDADIDLERGLASSSLTRDTAGTDSSLLVLYIDRFRVEQVIRNLVSNAIKFTPEGGDITMRLTRVAADNSTHTPASVGRLTQEGTNPIDKLVDESLSKQVTGYFRFEVVDNGAGIALENQSKMFNEFMQFNRNTLQGGGGSGLGLWICKNLAVLHGGRLDFHSDGEGAGSTFAVELPIYCRHTGRNEATEMDSVVSMPPMVQPRPRIRATNIIRVVPMNTSDEIIELGHTDMERVAQKLTVLIVDDSSPNRKIVKRMLESNANKPVLGDCCILEADDGSTALDLMRSETEAGRAIDFVLMDYVMIRMDGPEAVQRMRADLGYKGVVIGITGNALPEDMDKFRNHGANVVLTKPLTNEKLMDSMRQQGFDERMGRTT